MMSDGHTDSRRSQKTLTELETPVQNNYEKIVDQMFWLTKELQEHRRDVYDLTEVIGFLQLSINIQAVKIEEWVGVAEE